MIIRQRKSEYCKLVSIDVGIFRARKIYFLKKICRAHEIIKKKKKD